MYKKVFSLFVAFACSVVLTGCSGNNAPKQTIEMEMNNFSFTPSKIEAEPGQEIELKLESNGGAHNFVIDDLAVNSGVVGLGENATVTFTIPDNAKGKEYTFYCNVGNHRQEGMEGKITVK